MYYTCRHISLLHSFDRVRKSWTNPHSLLAIPLSPLRLASVLGQVFSSRSSVIFMRTLLQIYFSMSLTCSSFVSVLLHGTQQHVVSFYGITSCLLLALYWFLLWVSSVAQKYATHIAYSIYNMCILCALIFYIRTYTHTDAPLNELYTHTAVFVFRSYIHCLHTLWHFYAAKLCCIKFTVRMSNDSSCHQLATFVANIFVVVTHAGVVAAATNAVVVLQAERHES